jgi:hypothetical protein
MSWRWKCALLVLVCAAHALILFTFDLKPRPSSAHASRIASAHSMALYTIPAPGVGDVRQGKFEPAKTRRVVPVESLESLRQSPPPDEPPNTMDRGIALDAENFLTAEAVDETALPEEHFEEVLKQSLPYGLEAIELEIWIDQTGTAVLVQCLDQDNCKDSSDSLKQLLGLRFKPAIKDGLPVPSRKHISVHIDPPPTFGL